MVISFTYLGVKIKGIFSPPSLVVTSPQVDMVINDLHIEITGQVEIGSNIMINERQVLPDELERANVIEINARKLPVPTTIEQLQDNYELFESKDLDIYFT